MVSATFLAVIFAGCTHTTTTTTHALVSTYRVPEVSPVAQIDTLNEEAASRFRQTHESPGRCVFRGAVTDLFWKDEQKVDRAVLVRLRIENILSGEPSMVKPIMAGSPTAGREFREAKLSL